MSCCGMGNCWYLAGTELTGPNQGKLFSSAHVSETAC